MRAILVASLTLALGCGGESRPPGSAECPAGCKSCHLGTCADCTPDRNACADANQLVACNADGTLGAPIQTCDRGCLNGACLTACDVAAATHSYIGCDYWPTTTLTGQLNPYFDFAVAVANPVTGVDGKPSPPATVAVTRGTDTMKQVTVMPGQVKTILLPWVQELSQQPDCGGGGCKAKIEVSTLTPNGAYHLASSTPVTVYQFSPLQFQKTASQTCSNGMASCQVDADCGDLGQCSSGVCLNPLCFSYTNDATILLPTPALTGNYLVLARQTFAQSTFGIASSPGFFAVVATEDGTTVDVTHSANIESGKGVDDAGPGTRASYRLDKGGVLEVVSKHATSPCVNTTKEGGGVYCDLGPDYDVTGTLVKADKPVAVFGGHSCSFVPYNKWACDHLEQQLTPLETWGRTVAVAQTEPQTAGEPNVWRILSGSDGNAITFDPPVAPPTTLDKGRYVELVAEGAFQVTGSGPLLVGQFMVGQRYTSDPDVLVGDPSFGLGVPVEQYRTSYDFLTPDTYTRSYVAVIAPVDTKLTLDGADLSGGFQPIGGTSLAYRRVQIPPGAHHVESTDGVAFGIMVSGVASYTSYMYPGGLNLAAINPG